MFISICILMSCASSGGSVYVRVVLTLCKCIRVLCLISSGKAEQYNFLVISGVTACLKQIRFSAGLHIVMCFVCCRECCINVCV